MGRSNNMVELTPSSLTCSVYLSVLTIQCGDVVLHPSSMLSMEWAGRLSGRAEGWKLMFGKFAGSSTLIRVLHTLFFVGRLL